MRFFSKMGRDDKISHFNKCRICLNPASTTKDNDLFEQNNSNLLEKLKDLTGVMLNNEAYLPRYICFDCKLDLSRAAEFRQRFLDSQKFLLSINVEVEEIDQNGQSSLNERSYGGGTECDNSNDDGTYVPKKIGPLLKFKRPQKNEIKATTKRKYICEQCGNFFYTEQNLKSHLIRHSDEKPFECEICPERFFASGDLKRHMRSHTGEKPYPCRTCGRRFTESSSRGRHERVSHLDLRPYSCDICGKSFTNSYIMKNHMLVHTKERAFVCEICNKAFTRPNHLKTHYRSTYHKENSKKFAQNSVMNAI